AAGVGAADDERRPLAVERDGDGNDLAVGRLLAERFRPRLRQALVEQRMAAVKERQGVFVVELRPRRFRGIGEERASLQGIELAGYSHGVEDVVAGIGDELRDVAGDAGDLLP